MIKLLYPLIPPPSSVKMHASHASSTSRAHDLPALSESLVSGLRILLELRDSRRFAAVRGAGGASGVDIRSALSLARPDFEFTEADDIGRPASICSGVWCFCERRNAHGAAGRESSLS
jgi:hypothetical protein